MLTQEKKKRLLSLFKEMSEIVTEEENNSADPGKEEKAYFVGILSFSTPEKDSEGRTLDLKNGVCVSADDNMLLNIAKVIKEHKGLENVVEKVKTYYQWED